MHNSKIKNLYENHDFFSLNNATISNIEKKASSNLNGIRRREILFYFKAFRIFLANSKTSRQIRKFF
jgi:hypothetical protein